MNCKKRFQKVLCVFLTAASISSQITPVSHADTFFHQTGGGTGCALKGLLVDKKSTDPANDPNKTKILRKNGISESDSEYQAAYLEMEFKGAPHDPDIFGLLLNAD
ncbi:hypothetical protein FACS189481_3750 [Clostridia bacterium]|nr:hypothetical protein FACS189481_3750 [Clostridia bacterium]